MAKDHLNIEAKISGAQDSKQRLDELKRAARELGDETQQAGKKGEEGASKMAAGFGRVLSLLGAGGLIATIAQAARAVAEFFDTLNRRIDEAVQKLGTLRQGFEDIYEARGAFDEASRQRIAEETTRLLRDTSTTKEIGLPIVNAYERQFRGTMTDEEFNKGLRQSLSYGQRHGGAATPELIALMKGMGINTAEAQGAFMRQIAEGAARSGLTDAEVITALGRSAPTIKAMGWTGREAIENIAMISAGETGRMKASLPATTIEALGNAQGGNLGAYGLDAGLADDPKKLFEAVRLKGQGMTAEQRYKMISDVYGSAAAPGVSKLMSGDRGTIRSRLDWAAGPGGAAAEQAEIRNYLDTLEARDARAKAAADLERLDVTTPEQYREDVREVGRAHKDTLRRREPVQQAFREYKTPETMQDDDAAYFKWYDSLSAEERKEIYFRHRNEALKGPAAPYRREWESYTPQQRYEKLTGGPVINHYDYSTQYYPTTGDGGTGPRVPEF